MFFVWRNRVFLERKRLTNMFIAPAMHQVQYSHTKFEFPNPLNSSKYVGTSDEVDNAWMDIAYRKPIVIPILTSL